MALSKDRAERAPRLMAEIGLDGAALIAKREGKSFGMRCTSLIPSIAGLMGAWLSPRRPRRRGPSAQRCARDQPSRYVDVCAGPHIADPYSLRELPGSKGAIRRRRHVGERKRWVVLGAARNGAPRLRFSPDRQCLGRSPNDHFRDYCNAVNGLNVLHFVMLSVFDESGTRPVGLLEKATLSI